MKEIGRIILWVMYTLFVAALIYVEVFIYKYGDIMNVGFSAFPIIIIGIKLVLYTHRLSQGRPKPKRSYPLIALNIVWLGLIFITLDIIMVNTLVIIDPNKYNLEMSGDSGMDNLVLWIGICWLAILGIIKLVKYIVNLRNNNRMEDDTKEMIGGLLAWVFYAALFAGQLWAIWVIAGVYGIGWAVMSIFLTPLISIPIALFIYF